MSGEGAGEAHGERGSVGVDDASQPPDVDPPRIAVVGEGALDFGQIRLLADLHSVPSSSSFRGAGKADPDSGSFCHGAIGASGSVMNTSRAASMIRLSLAAASASATAQRVVSCHTVTLLLERSIPLRYIGTEPFVPI